MATPHQVSAVVRPLALDGTRTRQMLRGAAELRALVEVQQHVEAGVRYLELLCPSGTGRLRVGLACALAFPGPLLVLCRSARQRAAWRKHMQRLVADDPVPAMRAPAPSPLRRFGPSLALLPGGADSAKPPSTEDAAAVPDATRIPACCVALEQALHPALGAHEHPLVEQLGAPALILLDARDATAAELAFVRRYARPDTLLLSLHPCEGLQQGPWKAARRVLLEPALLVKQGLLAPYRWLDYLLPSRTAAATSPPPSPALDALAAEHGEGSLRAFVRSRLPSADANCTPADAMVRALARHRAWTAALLRVAAALGLALDEPHADFLRHALGEARVTAADWARVLEAFLASAETEATSPSTTLRLVRQALVGLDGAPALSRSAPHLASPAPDSPRLAHAVCALLTHEKQHRGRLRAVVLVAEAEATDLADGISRATVPRDRVEQLALRLAPREGPPRRFDPWALAQAAVARLARGDTNVLLCSPVWLPYLRGAESCDVVVAATELALPLPCVAAPLLWRASGAGPHEPRPLRPMPSDVPSLWQLRTVDLVSLRGRRTFEQALERDEAIAVLGDAGLCRETRPARQLLEASLPANGSTDAADSVAVVGRIDALNRHALARSVARAQALSSWQRAPFGHGEECVLVVRPSPGPPKLSLRRAWHRVQGFERERWQLLAQALWAVFVLCLSLPNLAGPVIGWGTAALAMGSILGRTQRRLRWLRMRALRPESTAELVADVGSVVLRSLRMLRGIHALALPTRNIHCREGSDGSVYVWLEGAEPELAREFVTALAEALGTIGEHRYIIGRGQLQVGDDEARTLAIPSASYHPVPSLFGQRRESAESYAGHWAQVFGQCKLRYAGVGKGRLMRLAHCAKNRLGLHCAFWTRLR